MEVNIIVQNLKCSGCANTITKELGNLEKVWNVQVEQDQSKVIFECFSKKEVEAVKTTLRTIGYPSIDEDNALFTKVKSMVSCTIGKMSQA